MMRSVLAAIWLALLPMVAAAQDVEALYDEALRLHGGQGVLQDHAAAARLLTQAAELGHAPSQNMLGRYYFEGLGVAQDKRSAVRWLEAAAADGAVQHLLDLAAVLETDPQTLPKAVALYSQAAEAGNMDAAVSLGVLYQEGRGVPQDYARARALYEGPAAAGHARAMNNLGLMLARGIGGDQDYARAATLFSAAAEQGLRQAMTNLGVLYENGFGVPLDEARATELYRAGGQGVQAELTYVRDMRLEAIEELSPDLTAQAMGGDPISQLQWASLVLSGQYDFDMQRQAAAFVQQAAQQGHSVSMFNLGLLYIRGVGVPQDFVLGYSWLMLAKARGVSEAEVALDQMRERMTAAQINTAQEMAKSHAVR